MKREEEEFKKELTEAYPLMKCLATGMLNNSDDIADVIQDVAASLWRNRASLFKASNRRAYIISSLKNMCITKLRMFGKTCNLDESLMIFSDDESLRDNRQLLATLIEKLPEMQRKVVTLELGGFSKEEISGEVDKSYENVRQILSRARKKLRELYLNTNKF